MAALISSGHRRRQCGRIPPLKAAALILLLFMLTPEVVSANEENKNQVRCGADDPSSSLGRCRNGPEALKLKIIAVASILVASMLGVCLPLFSRSVPALKPDSNIFIIVKAFASGVILATGYIHVLPDSFEYLTSDCLPQNPWAKFPFTTFVAMLSAVATQMVDSFAMSYYRKLRSRMRRSSGEVSGQVKDGAVAAEGGSGNGHGHFHGGFGEDHTDQRSQLLRHRVVAQVDYYLYYILYTVILSLILFHDRTIIIP